MKEKERKGEVTVSGRFYDTEQRTLTARSHLAETGVLIVARGVEEADR